jgi:hypothetical protein
MNIQPTPFEWFTLGVAVWAAVISTVLGIQELNKRNRRLKITLELLSFAGRHQIIISNTGFRPITIRDINVYVDDKNGDSSRDDPWAPESENPAFPFTLQDGDTKTFMLTEYMTGYIFSKEHRLHIVVYDGEGHTYTKYEEGEYNEKWGYHSIKSKKPAFIVNAEYAVGRFFSRFRR